MTHVSTTSATGAIAQPVNSTSTLNSTLSPEALQALFVRNYHHVKDAASGPGFTIEDIDRVIEATRSQLHHYAGPDDDAIFCRWISEVTAPALDRERTAKFVQMMEEHSKSVRKGLWSVIKNCSTLGAKGDFEGVVAELEQATWTKVFIDLGKWLAPGYSNNPRRKPAKLSTRLYEFARLQALGWRKDRIRARKRFVPLFDENGVPVDEKLVAEYGRPKQRPIVLGPGAEGAYDSSHRQLQPSAKENSAQAA